MTPGFTCKQEHRPLFAALQADCKTYPGGITALAEEIGCNKSTLANQLNPDDPTSPPTLARFLELCLLTQGRRTNVAICRTFGTVPMNVDVTPRPPEQAVQAFLDYASQASEILQKGSGYAADLAFDATERAELDTLLHKGLVATVEMISALRG